jgi:hypothetical protein
VITIILFLKGEIAVARRYCDEPYLPLKHNSAQKLAVRRSEVTPVFVFPAKVFSFRICEYAQTTINHFYYQSRYTLYIAIEKRSPLYLRRPLSVLFILLSLTSSAFVLRFTTVALILWMAFDYIIFWFIAITNNNL